MLPLLSLTMVERHYAVPLALATAVPARPPQATATWTTSNTSKKKLGGMCGVRRTAGCLELEDLYGGQVGDQRQTVALSEKGAWRRWQVDENMRTLLVEMRRSILSITSRREHVLRETERLAKSSLLGQESELEKCAATAHLVGEAYASCICWGGAAALERAARRELVEMLVANGHDLQPAWCARAPRSGGAAMKRNVGIMHGPISRCFTLCWNACASPVPRRRTTRTLLLHQGLLSP